MILVIGTEDCSRCDMVKEILNNKNIDYNYKLISEFTEDEKSNLLNMAKEAKQNSFPLILRDEKIITLQEV